MSYLSQTCIHMFSGGRDSTLAAVRLAERWGKLVLVTVTTTNLIGIERVIKRLVELKPHLAGDTEWLHVMLPHTIGASRRSSLTTCLPCHQVYLVTGVMIAERYEAKHIALGYTGYQSTWTEQTPYAIESLKRIMNSIGLSVVLPVVDLTNKEQAIAELRANCLSESSLEQKCMRQIRDAELPFDVLEQEIDKWGKDLRDALANRRNLHLDVLDRRFLSKIPEQ